LIISAPTSLYSSLLPHSQQDVLDVIFTISSNDPPRPTVSLGELSRFEEIRELPNKIYDVSTREVLLGQLIFTVNDGTQNQAAMGMKLFEAGQVLTFGDSEEVPELNALEIPEPVDLQHDINYLDLGLAGLTEDEIKSLTSAARDKFYKLNANLNDVLTTINDMKADIQDNQKMLNEVRKAKEATQTLINVSSVSSGSAGVKEEILIKLETREKELTAQRETLIEQVNTLMAEAKLRYDEILKLKEVIK
jgi:hypothetical protein